MKSMRTILVFVILLVGVVNLAASGPVAVYGIIERVIFEPGEKSPERIQVWGAFEYVDGGLSRPGGTSAPQRGYLYFRLPAGTAQAAAKTEWADLKAIAGTGQAIGFGNWGYIGAFSGLSVRTAATGDGPPYFLELYPGGGRQTDVRVRPQSESPARPATYSTNAGMVKLSEQGSHAKIVKELREALKTR